MKQGFGFNPTEIIFALTDKCNLNCTHCYVSKNNLQLQIKDALDFLESCTNSQIDTIGFSGGEPFLYLDFLLEICEVAVQNDFMFDRIMTNGVWWKTKTDLNYALQKLYDSGFDGKIGLSWDSFHGQNVEQISTFCNSVYEIFNDFSIIQIQSVVNPEKNVQNEFLQKVQDFSRILNCKIKKMLCKNGYGKIILQNEKIFLNIDLTPQVFATSNPDDWNDKSWFKEDFCSGPGQILYIHPNGNIAPCCGFSNEENALIIGNIKQDLKTVLQQAEKNKMVQICYKTGLLNFAKQIERQNQKISNRTKDNCQFCSWLCKQK